MEKINAKSGLRLRFNQTDPEIRKPLLKFAVWLRENFDFPVRVTAHLNRNKKIKTINGEEGTASFFVPIAQTNL